METVTVTQQNEYVILMIWNKQVTDADVKRGFNEVNNLLSAARQPMFVMVDILANPKFPIAATLTGALFGPYRNSNLREWLIVGSNATAEFIERTLSGTTGRKIVRWFANEAEANHYVREMVGDLA